MKTFIIPPEPVEFIEGQPPEAEHYDEMLYEVAEGEWVVVQSWIRWSCYDFIFGLPRKDSPKYAQEVGFFIYRDSRSGVKKGRGFYIDIIELESLVDGYSLLLALSKGHSPHLWSQHKTEEERIALGQMKRAGD